MSALPKFTIKELLDAGVHFGHKTMRWNPKMAPYIYGDRNNIHIIDLQRTVPMLHKSLEAVHEVAARNGRILFVSTKRQASDIVQETATRCGQYYVNHRWLGGMLTNWGTISKSIKTLNTMQDQLDDPEATLNKKERLQISRKMEKLERALGGIKDMGGVPDLVFIIDTNKEHIAIKESNTLGIPVVAIVDTNSNPDNITHIVPGNDDSTRSIQLYCDLVADAVLAGLESSLGKKAPANDPATDKPAAKKAPAKKTEAKKEAPAEEKAAAKKPVAKKTAEPKAEKEATAKKADEKKAS
jgi:small subunit ribosomal protein S2